MDSLIKYFVLLTTCVVVSTGDNMTVQTVTSFTTSGETRTEPVSYSEQDKEGGNETETIPKLNVEASNDTDETALSSGKPVFTTIQFTTELSKTRPRDTSLTNMPPSSVATKTSRILRTEINTAASETAKPISSKPTTNPTFSTIFSTNITNASSKHTSSSIKGSTTFAANNVTELLPFEKIDWNISLKSGFMENQTSDIQISSTEKTVTRRKAIYNDTFNGSNSTYTTSEDLFTADQKTTLGSACCNENNYPPNIATPFVDEDGISLVITTVLCFILML